MLYMRFMLCLGFGLIGMSFLLKTLIDEVFLDWDMVGDIRHYFRELSRRNRRARYLQDDDQAEVGRLSWQQSRYQFAHRELPEPVAAPDSDSPAISA